MGWWKRFLAFLGLGTPSVTPPGEPILLDASSEAALADSIAALARGQLGWITIQSARSLFSPFDRDDPQGLFDWDEEGIRRLGEFAAENRSTPQRQGDRVFFTRN